MRKCILIILAGLFTLKLAAALPPEYEQLKTEAEKLYADKSFAKAHELYARAMVMTNHHVERGALGFFRNADTLWRSQAATQTADTTKLDAGSRSIGENGCAIRSAWRIKRSCLGRGAGIAWGLLLDAAQSTELGCRRGRYYQAALDWWAGARDIELARARYLAFGLAHGQAARRRARQLLRLLG